jgi:PD-(D/E)XK nuclease superfamily
MSLRFVTGAANSGKTGEVLKEALLAAAVGASPVLVVPSHADARRLESELAGKRPLGVRVSTLRQFVQDTWVLHGDGRRIVGSFERDSLIAGLLARDVAGPLASIADAPGLRRLLSRFAAHGGLDSQPAERQGSVARSAAQELLESYCEALERAGLVEEQTARQILAESEAKLSGPVGFLRFDTFSARDADFLLGLADLNEVNVALTWEPSFAPTRANDGIAAVFSELASEHVKLTESQPDEEIIELARALFGGPRGIASRGNVITGVAFGAEAEIALAVRFVAESIEEGTAPERVALVFPDLARRVDGLRAAFRAAGIPVEFETSLRFSATAFGRAFMSLLILASGGGGREEALTFSASPFSGADAGAVQRLDRLWRTGQSVRSTGIAGSLRDLGETTRLAVDAALAVSRTSLTPTSLPKWQELADMLLRAVNEQSQRAVPVGLLEDSAAAYQAFSIALSEMASGPAALQPFEAVRALGDVTVRVGSREAMGRVQVCEFGGIGARRFDVVVMGGLNDDEISTISRGSLEEEWQPAGGSVQEASAGDLVRLKFYSMVTRARDRLVLVRQEGDGEGREHRPSALWEDAIEAYVPSTETGGELRSALPATRMSGSQVEAFAPQLTHGRARARNLASGLRFSETIRSHVVSESGLSAIRSHRPYSATEVETYLQCPFRWFHERIVRPGDIDPEFDLREQGERAHRLLAAFHQRLADERPRTRVSSGLLGEALELFDEVAETELSRMAQPRSLSERLVVAQARSWARSAIEADADFLPGFVPQHVEIAFGDEPPFLFAGLAFRGRIDRIDASPTCAFVTDYKSSRDVVGVGKFDERGKVQPLIYAAAAEALLRVPVAGSAYRSLRGGEIRGFWRRDLLGEAPQGMHPNDALDERGYSELVERTSELVVEAVDGMKAGRVEPRLAARDACGHCGVSAVCEGLR